MRSSTSVSQACGPTLFSNANTLKTFLNGARKAAGKCRDERLVGIVLFGDVALYGNSQQADTAVTAVSEPDAPHTQSG